MKKLMRPIITLGLGFLLALVSAALTYSTPPALEGTFNAGMFFSVQPTSTPQPNDLSEIGSTDGIVIMGFLIALIVIVPILLRRKAWMENH
jgi:predicted membrane protein